MDASLKHLRLLIIIFDLAIASAEMKVPIVGGYPEYGVIPYIVSLERDGGHKCGGSIINEQTILTAAHCLWTPYDNLIVLVGSKWRSLSQHVSISDVHVHPNYTHPMNGYDIGLVRLSWKLEFSPFIWPIRLASIAEELPDGSRALACGWGDIIESNPYRTDILFCVSVPVINQSICESLMGVIITETMLCAANLSDGIGACNGDSGGPLVAKGTQFGIISWGEKGCVKPNLPNVLARVSILRPWVDDILAEHYNEKLIN